MPVPRPCLLTACLLTLPALASAAFPSLPDDHVEDLGAYLPTFFAEFQDVELQGDQAFVFGVGGLAIMDVATPEAPALAGRYEPPGDPYVRFYRGAVAGGHAYGGAREDGLMTIDVAPSLNPVRTAVLDPPGVSYEGCTVSGGLLFACRHAAGLQILDLTDPATPEPVGEFPGLVNAWDVEVRGDRAYVADGLGGLAILDVSDPAAPILLGTAPTPGAAVDVVLDSDVAAVACGSAGVVLIDVSDPAAPVTLATHDTSGLAITLDGDPGGLLAVADWDDIELVDISDPAAPAPAGHEDTPVRAMGLAFADGRLHVADWSRFRTYAVGPSSRGDVAAPLRLDFGDVPVGDVVDTTITVANTGGGPLNVSGVTSFNPRFEVLTPASFVLGPGAQHPLMIRYHNDDAGHDAGILRLDSDDTDESELLIRVSGEPDPHNLDVGEPAPDFALTSLGGVEHSLAQYRGRVVVLAFFANW